MKVLKKPLIIDLDNTLLKTDTLLESCILLIKSNPIYIISMIYWLIKGKLYFKNKVSEKVELSIDLLPKCNELIGYLENEKSEGRKIYLATASLEKTAKAVCDYFNIFDSYFASTIERNLKGIEKCKVLCEKFGEKGFVYAGDSRADFYIWEKADSAIAVNLSKKQIKKLEQITKIESEISNKQNKIILIIKEMRIYQWVKNLLIFLPLLLAHIIYDPKIWLSSLIAFVAYSLTASSVYLLNDILDLNSDRQHRTKHRRPFASGNLSLKFGIFLTPVLLILAYGLTFFLPLKFILWLSIYLLATLAYSFIIKKLYLLDILVLAGLYTLRIIAGGAATQVYLSPWLMAFSMFIFLSLAAAKRYTELLQTDIKNEVKLTGRGYKKVDMPLLGNLGLSSGLLSVLVFAIYTFSPEVAQLYKSPKFIFSICPILLYWIGRIWFLTGRGELTDDPVVFAVKDKISYLIAIIIVSLIIISTI